MALARRRGGPGPLVLLVRRRAATLRTTCAPRPCFSGGAGGWCWVRGGDAGKRRQGGHEKQSRMSRTSCECRPAKLAPRPRQGLECADCPTQTMTRMHHWRWSRFPRPEPETTATRKPRTAASRARDRPESTGTGPDTGRLGSLPSRVGDSTTLKQPALRAGPAAALCSRSRLGAFRAQPEPAWCPAWTRRDKASMPSLPAAGPPQDLALRRAAAAGSRCGVAAPGDTQKPRQTGLDPDR